MARIQNGSQCVLHVGCLFFVVGYKHGIALFFLGKGSEKEGYLPPTAFLAVPCRAGRCSIFLETLYPLICGVLRNNGFQVIHGPKITNLKVSIDPLVTASLHFYGHHSHNFMPLLSDHDILCLVSHHDRHCIQINRELVRCKNG